MKTLYEHSLIEKASAFATKIVEYKKTKFKLSYILRNGNSKQVISVFTQNGDLSQIMGDHEMTLKHDSYHASEETKRRNIRFFFNESENFIKDVY